MYICVTKPAVKRRLRTGRYPGRRGARNQAATGWPHTAHDGVCGQPLRPSERARSSRTAGGFILSSCDDERHATVYQHIGTAGSYRHAECPAHCAIYNNDWATPSRAPHFASNGTSLVSPHRHNAQPQATFFTKAGMTDQSLALPSSVGTSLLHIYHRASIRTSRARPELESGPGQLSGWEAASRPVYSWPSGNRLLSVPL